MGRRKKSSDNVLLSLEGIFRSPSSLEAFLKKPADEPFVEYCKSFKQSEEYLYAEMHKAILKLSHQPLFTAYLSWIENGLSYDSEICKHAHILVSEKFLNFIDEDNCYLPIASLKNFDHKKIINQIRSKRELSLDLREKLVSTYLHFTHSLELTTFDYVSRAFDPDEMKRQGRSINYSMFIKLLGHLDDKMQLVAKLLYFGGSRTLDEVLSLDVKDINFDEEVIRYKSQLISYPAHVFSDLRAIVNDRNKLAGRVFVGRQGANLNPATVFRNFKEAASRVGLGDSFSPKGLTTNT